MAVMSKPYPYPGIMPDKPPPSSGDQIVIQVAGLPPYKDISFSIRNPKHKYYERFVKLREAATKAMAGRCWYHGGIVFTLKVQYIRLDDDKTPLDYIGGIMDSLDGSHGPSFTYLPVVYQDDCQVYDISPSFIESDVDHYELLIRFGPD
jgi:hypothetical protein